jgi:hypothetical protein
MCGHIHNTFFSSFLGFYRLTLFVGKGNRQQPTLEGSSGKVLDSGRLRPYLQILDYSGASVKR